MGTDEPFATSISITLGGAIVLGLLAYVFLPQSLEGPQPDPSQDRCEPKSAESDPDHTPRPTPGEVKAIHLANDGQFLDRCELTDALYELNWDVERGGITAWGVRPRLPTVKPEAKSRPRLTLLYVHGWKHDASDTDSDLVAFKNLVKALDERYRNEKQVLGVYVTWNALNGWGILDNLSFWSKKRIADRISQSAVVTKIIASIGAMRQRDEERFDQFIVIGHSFGARMVFSATSQPLVAAVSRSHPGARHNRYEVIPGSADAIILLNPAFEASLYTALEGFCRETEKFSDYQPPLLVSISTDNDGATRNLFPIGQWLAMFRTDLEQTTLGNFERYRTHTLTANSADCPNNGRLTEGFAAAGLCLTRDLTLSDPSKKHCEHNPFLIAGTTKDVIDGHNGIWTDPFSEWMSAFLAALERHHQEAAERRAARRADNQR